MFKVIDNFLGDEYKSLENYSLSCKFEDVKNPIDDVVYPLICSDIPKNIQFKVVSELELILGRQPEDITMFMRMSPEGVHVPHPVHHDGSMGQYSLMLYLFDVPGAGTAFLRHNKTGITRAPSEDILDWIISDQTNLDAWSVVDFAQSAENMAIIFDADIMHCATPVGGFGKDQSDSRIVLTAFFS